MVNLLRGIFAAILCGDCLLALIALQLSALREKHSLSQKELGEILRQETAKTQGLIVSVSAVRTSPDLSFAKVFLSVFPSGKGKEIIDNVNDQQSKIRYSLAQKVRYQLRVMPELRFIIDDSLDYLERIDQLLKK